jgi:DNA-binding MarR family transcriptional regulator
MAEVTPLHGAGSGSDVPAPDSSTRADVAALAAALRQVDAAHRRLRTRLAHRLGLTVTDLTALLVISESTNCTPKRLAGELGLTSGTVTAVIDRLVDAQQVRRVPKVGDRRSILLELTAGGGRTIETVSGLYLGGIATALESSPHIFNRYILDSLRSTAAALNGTAEAADLAVSRSELTA